MSLSDDARYLLDKAVEKIRHDGQHVWGFIIQPDEDGEAEDFEVFSSYTADSTVLVNNTLQALKAIAPDIDTPETKYLRGIDG